MRGVLLILILLVIPLVSSEYYFSNRCAEGGSLPVLNNIAESPDYCIEDADCTLILRKTCGGSPCNVSSLSLQSGYGMGINNHVQPYFSFGASGCTTEFGCALPYNWGSTNFAIATFTIPGDTYNYLMGPITHVQETRPCPGGSEIIGYRWNYLKTLEDLHPIYLNGDCSPQSDCRIRLSIYDQSRIFVGGITVIGKQGGNTVHFLDSWEQGSELSSITSDSFILTIPEDTFTYGTVDLQIYDLTNKIPYTEQEGTIVQINYPNHPAGTLNIDVFPEECYASSPCNVEITLNRALDSSQQEFFINDSLGNHISHRLTDTGVTLDGTTIHYTTNIVGEQLAVGPITVGVEDGSSGTHERDEELIIMIEDNPTYIPTYCGDGTVQTPNNNNVIEECDDGNIVNGDGCSSTCQNQVIPVCDNDGNVDSGEDCDCGSNGICTSSELDDETCQTQDFDSGYLSCNSDCTFDFSDCEDNPTGPGNTNNPPIVGPNQYILNSDCEEDSNPNDEFGELTWTVYNQYGVLNSTGTTTCVLEREKIPFIGVYSIFLFVLILVGFYVFRKKQ